MNHKLDPLHTINKISFSISTELRKLNYNKLFNPNTGMKHNNTTLNASVTPGGIGGSFVTISSNRDIIICGINTSHTIGVLADDTNSPFGINHDYATVYVGGIFKTSIFETFQYINNNIPITYEPMDKLFVSPYGLLTKEPFDDVNNGSCVGYVIDFIEEEKSIIYKLYDINLEPSSSNVDIVDSLSSINPNKALSAKQGNVLDNKISQIQQKNVIYIFDNDTINQGYFDIMDIPHSKQDMSYSLIGGSEQINFWSEIYPNLSELDEPADFALGKKDGTLLNRVYFRSDGNDGGYNSTELFDGTLVPSKMPEVGSILVVSYLKKS